MKTPPFRMSPIYCITYAEVNKEPYGQIGALKQNASIYVLATASNMARIRFRISSNEWAEAQCHLTDLQNSLTNEVPSKPIKPKRVTVAFSPRGEALNLILEELSHAQNSVDVAMFTLSNRDLVDAFCYFSEKRKIAVRYFADEENLTEARKIVMDKLKAAGVTILIPDTFDAKMHLKCAVIDRQTVISGTANWTEDAFNANFEDTVIVESSEWAQKYEAFFEEMMKGFRIGYEFIGAQETPPPVKAFPVVKKRMARKPDQAQTMTELAAPPPKTFTDVSVVRVYFSPRAKPSAVWIFVACLFGHSLGLRVTPPFIAAFPETPCPHADPENHLCHTAASFQSVLWINQTPNPQISQVFMRIFKYA